MTKNQIEFNMISMVIAGVACAIVGLLQWGTDIAGLASAMLITCGVVAKLLLVELDREKRSR